MRRVSALLSLFVFLLLTSIIEAATITGVVRDPDGRPVPGARVIASGSAPAPYEAVTSSSGTFTLEGLPDGRHVLRVVLEGFSAAPVTVDAREQGEPVSITLRVSALSESVVVSAATVDLPLSQTASSVTVVSGTELDRRQVRELEGAVRTVPGLHVAKNGGIGSLTSLFTRGGESDFTLVLIDGMRANAFGGGLDLSQVPLVDADRVEIVRGPQSAVFGSDAIGGVIQVISRRTDRERLDATLEAGSQDSVLARVGASGATRGVQWSARAEHAESAGFKGIAPATRETVSNDDAELRHAAGTLGWRDDSGAEVRGQVQLSQTERGFPGAYGSNPIRAYTNVDRVSRGENDRRYVGAAWLQPWSGAGSRVRQRSEVSLADFDSTFVSPFGTSEAETRRLDIRTQTDVALNAAFGLSAGFEFVRERAGSTFITGEAFEPIPVQRSVAGYFGEARYSPSARLSVAGGVRLEQIRRDALPGNPSRFGPRPAFPEDTITSANPRLAIAYLLRGEPADDATTLRASAGTGIRPPDAFEIAFTDNPGLKPERSRSIDAGIRQTFARGTASVEATAFFNEYDDLIVAVGRSFRDASRYRTDNISNARARGLELSVSVRPAAAFDIRASYTRLATEILAIDRTANEAPAPYRVGEALIRRPRHQGSLVGLYAAGRWTGFAELRVRGAVRDIEPTFGAFGGVFDAEGFATADFGATVRLVRRLDLFGRVENAAGRAYEEAFGFPAPGRTLFGGIRFAAGR